MKIMQIGWRPRLRVEFLGARGRVPTGVEFPRFAPTWSVPIDGNAMTKTDTTKLDKLRHALLQLHKALLDAQRIRYERENGRIESRGELLALVLEDASFEWLRTLVRFEGNDGFTGPYRGIVDAVPDALVAHVQLSRLLADFGAAGRAR